MDEVKEATRSLAQKIMGIQDAVGMVKKRGKFGSEMGGSAYLRIEDAVLAVNKLMAASGLILTGTLQKKPDGTFYFERQPHSTKGYIVSVVMEWTLEDTESKETRSYNFPGDGYDGTDKAVYKAETGSRKYAIINIFNLPIGNDAEDHGAGSFEDGKKAQKNVAASKIAKAAGEGNQTAIDALSQIEPERRVIISRPEALNGHYVAVSGFIANPPLDTFFNDCGAKRFQTKGTGEAYWRLPSDYEKGLVALCEKLKIEVEG